MGAASPSYDDLAAMVVELRGRVVGLERENADLRRQLRAVLGKQDKPPPTPPPFAKPPVPPRRKGKKPGRPAGHPPALRPPPPGIHRDVTVPLPAGPAGETGGCLGCLCPDCRGGLDDLKDHDRVVEDI